MKETALVKMRREKAEELYPIARALLEKDFTATPSLTLSVFSGYVANYTFAGAAGLKTITLPNVTTISNNVFSNMPDLEAINAPKLTTILSNAITYCPKLSSLSFPLLNYLDSYAFSYITALESISFPKLTRITNYAFYFCSNLRTIYIPEVTTFDGNAFYSCSSVLDITAPKLQAITAPWTGAPSTVDFASFPSLVYIAGLSNYLGSSIVLSQGMTFTGVWSSPNITKIDCQSVTSPFSIYDCPKLETINLPMVPAISNNNPFSGCSSLKSINMPSASVRIGPYAFYNCMNLSEVCFSKASWDLGNYSSSAFYNMSSISRLILPNIWINSLYSSNLSCLRGSRPLTLVQLGTVNYMYSYALYGLSYMRRFGISYVAAIYSYVFSGCSQLNTVLFRNLYNIYSYAFSGASALRSLYILNSSTIPTLQYTNAFNGTPFVSSYDGEGGFASIYVRESLRSQMVANTSWMAAMNEARIVGLTDEEVADALAMFGWADGQPWHSTISD